MKRITIREIADDTTTISSTRWAFASVIKVDIAIVVLTLLAGLVAHFVPGVVEIPNSFYGHVALLLGILTGIITTSKTLQGFEPPKTDTNTKEKEIQDDIEER